MTKRVLLIAFHFPPIKASSGLERTLALARHLPANGWEPLVLTASPKAYPAVSDERMGLIPAGTPVRRAFARDATKALSVAGRYPHWATLPDRWASWLLGAIPAGLAMIREHRPDLIWSTYPIASAHLIGHALHRISGVPWVADFRDPMVEFNERLQSWSPSAPGLRRLRLWTEGIAARNATAITTCTEGARRILVERYPQHDAGSWAVVSNGYDESAFASASEGMTNTRCGDELLLLHSGTIYPTPDRDPTFFLRALQRVIERRGPDARKLRVLFRASSVDTLYLELIQELGLAQHVSFAPAIPYEGALNEMLRADGVLLFQGYTSNPAIPAKLYEYFRAQRPILALADSQGDTARLIRQYAAGELAPLDDVDAIAEALHRYIEAIEGCSSRLIAKPDYERFERKQTVASFAAVFEGALQRHKSSGT